MRARGVGAGVLALVACNQLVGVSSNYHRAPTHAKGGNSGSSQNNGGTGARGGSSAGGKGNAGSAANALGGDMTSPGGTTDPGGDGGAAGGSGVGGSDAGAGGGAGAPDTAGGSGGGGGAGGTRGGTGTNGGDGGADAGTSGQVVPTERNGCAITPGLLADFEEGDATPVVVATEGRTGGFEIFNDQTAGATETSSVEATGGTAECKKYALHVQGSGFTTWGAGMGLSLVGAPASPSPYDATTHQFTGIRFKAKLGSNAAPTSPVRFNLVTPWTESSDNPGGSCTPTTATANKAALDCYQHAGRFLTPGSGAGQLTAAFQVFTLCFDRDLYPLSLPTNLTPSQRDGIGSKLLKLQFQFNVGKDYSGAYPGDGGYPSFSPDLPFDLWLDDVEFITGACPNTTPSPSNGAPAKGFPLNAGSLKYGSCDAAKNARTFNNALAEAYATWTANFVRGNTVIVPEQSNAVTSESMGYGMMLAAAVGDKAAFQDFWGYVQSKLSGGLMIWKDGQSGSATDADVDIAYALIIAGLQWGGSYAASASTMASNIATKDTTGNVLRAGSAFLNSNFNASYFAPAAFRKIAGSSTLITTNYALAITNINAGSARVPTDWADPSNGQPTGPGAAAATSNISDGNNGAMGYDGARVPWRLGQDICLGGTEGTTQVGSVVSYFANKYDGGERIDLMKGGWYKQSTSPHPNAKDALGIFIGPMGVAGMAVNNLAMRDSAFRAVLDILESGDQNHVFLPSTIALITALIMSGNFPVP